MVLSQGNIVYSWKLFFRLKWVLCPIITLFPPIRIFSKTIYDGVVKSTNYILWFRSYSIILLFHNELVAMWNEFNRKLIISILTLKRFFSRIKNKYFLADTAGIEVLAIK